MFRDPERIPKELQCTANSSSVWQLPGPWSCVAEGVPLRNTKELLPRGSRTKCNGRKSAALLGEFRKRPSRKPIKGKCGESQTWDGMASIFATLAERNPAKLTSETRHWLKAIKLNGY